MSQQIGEDTKVTLDLKTIGIGVAGLGSLIAMWFALQSDIALAKELPIPPDPCLRLAVKLEWQAIGSHYS